MKTKLTLRLDTDTIERAKDYAKGADTSVSALVERYLDKLTGTEPFPQQKSETPILDELSKSPPVTFKPEDLEDDPRLEYIWRKHGR